MSPLPKQSRGVEYTLDTTNWTATKTWEYIYNPSFFARAMGSNQTLDNTYRLINYGLCYRPNPSFVLVDDNQVISELFFKDSIFSYRSFTSKLNHSFLKPEINCYSGTNNITLVASGGHDKYIWNTGDTTATIVVTDTGSYQVWVNKGIGMVGSNPIQISNISTYCNQTSSLNDLTKNSNKGNILTIYDLQGKTITNPIKNHLYLIKYSSGITEKEIWNPIVE
jgi:hypothetical protein